jgi:hypothetical protein
MNSIYQNTSSMLKSNRKSRKNTTQGLWKEKRKNDKNKEV